MQDYKKTALLLILVLISGWAYSQGFPEDHKKFSRDFCNRFKKVQFNDRDGKELTDQFEAFWESDSLSKDEKDNYIQQAEKLLRKGAQGFPHFYLYAENILLFQRNGMGAAQYQNWIDGMQQILDEKKRPNPKRISEYQEVANNLFRHNVIFSSPRVEWCVNQLPDDFILDESLHLDFSGVRLMARHSEDSVVIYNTSGKFYPLKEEWVGKQGRVTWERVKMNPDSVYAELDNYNIDVSKPEFEVDTAQFINLHYFNIPILGKLSDKAGNLDNPAESRYPRFESFQRKFELKKIFDGIDYEGGFSMSGKTFIGKGFKNKPAQIRIRKNDSLSFIALSQEFVLDPDKIFSTDTEIKIMMNSDSIYHPSLTFRYDIADKRLELVRDGEGMSKVYFSDSYHKLHMNIYLLEWKIDEYQMHLGMLKTMSQVNEAYFESEDFFAEKRYKDIQIRDAVHPFKRLESFVSWYGSPDFYANDFAEYIRYSPVQVKQLLLRLAYMGFIHYDPDTEVAEIKDEMFKYVDAIRGIVDYDVIEFYSKTSGRTPNASLSLLDYDLKINGVPTVQVSDSQNVIMYPIDKRITVKKNRHFEFDGTVRAGQFFFYGHKLKFDYDEFKIDLAHCDSMKMIVESGKYAPDGGKILKIVQNTIENLNIEFFIDSPGNKSGRKEMPQYPKVESEKHSYVYYDKSSKYKGVYDRQRFFFKIDPFVIDSIEGYARKNLQFDGTFYSSDIFPDFEETLVVRPDYSLGFHRYTPKDGFSLYAGKAQYYQDIDLSNQGLRGKGSIEYLNSTNRVDSIVFWPDSTHAHSTYFAMRKQKSPVEYPSTVAHNTSMKWYPYDDEYYVTTRDQKMKMFDGQAYLKGTLLLQSTGLKGEGVMDIEKSKLSSDLFTYKQDFIDADTSDFKLLGKEKLEIDFSTTNVNAHIDFIQRFGKFKTNGDGSYVDFPKNKYIGYMNQLKWYMDEEMIDIKAPEETMEQLMRHPNMSDEEFEDLFLEGPRFISVHPDQDSLQFVSPIAHYDLEKYIIFAEGVRFLRVADVTIYTSNGNVVVEKDAVMRPLTETRIIANTTNRYHTIYNSTVNVLGRKSYTGYGDYDYIDKAGRKQVIHFDRIGVDTTIQTYAKGGIAEPDNFTLSPNFKYQGKVRLFANQEFLVFDGAVLLKHQCRQILPEWLQFETSINPEEILIPVDSAPMDINNYPLGFGVFLSRDSIYSAFSSTKTRSSDASLFISDGYLKFDENDKTYEIANKDKLEEPSLPGNMMSLNRVNCDLKGEGRISLSNLFGQFKPNASGKFDYDLETDTVSMEMVMLMDFYFNEKAFDILAGDINKTSGLTGIDLDAELYEKAIMEYLGQEKADEWFADISMGNMQKIPEEMENLFILTDVRMKYYQDMESYIHYGPVGIGSIGKTQINRSVFSFISVEQTRRGDKFTMYLELSADKWYYFTYSRGKMAALSNNREFNQEIYNTRPKQREQKVKKGEPLYRYASATETFKRRFVKAMNRRFGFEED